MSRLETTVAGSADGGVTAEVGPIATSQVVLRVEPAGDDQYLVYLDVRDASGEWRRLHRSTLTATTASWPAAIRKLE